MDPYASPEVDPTSPTGTLDLMQAISEGVGALIANIGSAIGVLFLAILVYCVAMIPCGLGLIAAGPLLFWGLYRWSLDAYDGHGTVGVLFSGTDDFGDVFVRVWGYFLLYFVISIPLVIVIVALTLPGSFEAALSGQQPDPLMSSLQNLVPSVLFGLLICRLFLAPYYLVERKLGAVDAMKASWEVTAGSWGKLIGLQLLIMVLGLPAQVLSVGIAMFSASLDQTNPQETIDALPIIFGLYLGAAVVGAAVYMLTMLMYASVYRQLAGPAPQAA